MTLLLKKRTVN